MKTEQTDSRLVILIRYSQREALDALSAKSGAPLAELVRRMIDAGLKEEREVTK